MMTTYQKFQNPPPYTNMAGENGTIAQSNAFQPNQTPQMVNAAVPSFTPQKKELKAWSSLKMLVRVEMILAILMIVFEAIMDGAISEAEFGYGPGRFGCSLGTGVWVGVLGVIAAGLGFGAFRTSHGHKCTMVAHFVMSIICAVADGILVIFASICLSGLPYMMRGSYTWDRERGTSVFKESSPETVAMVRGLIALESFLLLAAIVHFISSIISTAFICRNWCQGSEPQIAVVYLPGAGGRQPEGNETAADPYRIAVPSGVHVIFVQTGNGGQTTTIQPQQPPQPEFRNPQGLGDEKRV